VGILVKGNAKHRSILGIKQKVKEITQRLFEVKSLLSVSPLQPQGISS
jgi:hypothetical protein